MRLRENAWERQRERGSAGAWENSRGVENARCGKAQFDRNVRKSERNKSEALISARVRK